LSEESLDLVVFVFVVVLVVVVLVDEEIKKKHLMMICVFGYSSRHALVATEKFFTSHCKREIDHSLL
jgi:hypothetical protein